MLIVDDNEGDLTLLKEAIAETGWGVDISEASTGQQAVKMMRERAANEMPPDLILMDYRLGSGTCIEVLQDIRGMSGYESIPIIAMSTVKLPDIDQERVFAHGVLKILIKASDYASLVKMVTTLRKILAGKGDISSGGSWISDSDLALLGDG
jgi:CheY-like chemotaxis protein